MKRYYLIRLDDACPNMDSKKWLQMENLLDKYGIKPLVGIIPQNADTDVMFDSTDGSFWSEVQSWKEKGWTLALHGYNHVCDIRTGGINPVHKRSEFAGLSYHEQRKKIEKGYSILKNHGIEVEWFFAPSHTFDKNTLRAIKDSTPIRYISDMISTKPFESYGLTFAPCQMGRFRDLRLSGYWCACYHPNVMKEEEFETLEKFIESHHQEFIPFTELPRASKKGIIDRLLSFFYFFLRRVRG